MCACPMPYHLKKNQTFHIAGKLDFIHTGIPSHWKNNKTKNTSPHPQGRRQWVARIDIIHCLKYSNYQKCYKIHKET